MGEMTPGDEILLGYMLARHDQWLKATSTTVLPRTIARRLGISLLSPGRLWSRVEETEAGCWEWQGCVHPNGYVEVTMNGERWYGHRLAWTIANGSIPAGLMVCHHCDNRRCVCPDHLFLGTALDNNRDREAKGRGRHGPNAPSRQRAA